MKATNKESAVNALFALEKAKPQSAGRIVLTTAGLAAFVCAVAWTDYLTGSAVSVGFFYFLPIGLASLRLGRTGGVSMALLAALTQGLANYYSAQHEAGGLITTWNVVMRLAAFTTVALLVERVGMLLAKERAIVAELRKALAEVEVLEGLLPICSQCKKIRNEDGRWEMVENYIEGRTPAKFTHGMCPDCTKNWLQSAGLTEADLDRALRPKV